MADDHPLYRRGIVRALERSGAFDVVDQASDGATALALIRRHRPDVAVLDVRMPAMDGIDVIAALARHGPPVPVVLLSAFDDERIVAAGLEAGAAAYVSKGADRDAVCLDVAAAARAGAARSPSAIRGRPDLERRRLANWTPRLTVAEHELLQLGAGAPDTSALARLAGLDEAAVRRRLDSLLAKLGADDFAEALDVARAHDLVRRTPPPGARPLVLPAARGGTSAALDRPSPCRGIRPVCPGTGSTAQPPRPHALEPRIDQQAPCSPPGPEVDRARRSAGTAARRRQVDVEPLARARRRPARRCGPPAGPPAA